MAKSKHTKPVEPIVGDRGTSVMIDGNCYVKSTDKTSTWQVPASDISNDDVCSAIDSGPNVIQFDNVDWNASGMFAGHSGHTRPYKMTAGGFYKGHDVLPLGEDSYRALVDWDINKNITMGVNPQTKRDQWEFEYVDGNDDKTFPYSATIKPKRGQMNQYVIKFKEPINVPANTTIHWWWNHQNGFTAHGPGGKTGHNKAPYNYGEDLKTGNVGGGFFTEPDIKNLPVQYAWWTGSVCGGLAYFVNTNTDWVDDGLQGVHWMVTPPLIQGCGPTFVKAPHLGPAHFRQVALGITGTPRILTEGLDF